MTDDNNIVPLPQSLDKLADEIREAEARRQGGRAEWIEGTLVLGARMLEGRRRFDSNTDFSVWLSRNELNFLNKDDQGAILEMAREPETFRITLQETTLINLQTIRNDTFRSLMSQRTPENLPPNPVEPTTATISSIFGPATSEEDELEVVIRKGTRGRGKKGKERPKKARVPANSKDRLREEHGEAGIFLDAWVKTGLDPTRVAPVFAGYWLGNLPTRVVEEIAEFVRTHPDLPPPFLGTKEPSPRLFWERMPQQLLHRVERLVPLLENGKCDFPNLMLATIDEWGKSIDSALAAWVAAGKPYDSRAWYHRYISGLVAKTVPVAAPVLVQTPITPQFLASLPPAMAEILNDDRPYDAHHSGFQPSGEGIIRAYGAQVWPRPAGARWTFRDAFYAFHIWNELQPLMKETRPAERARALMNPFQPILANLHGASAAALREILVAQYQYPERADDTTAPPKRLNFE